MVALGAFGCSHLAVRIDGGVAHNRKADATHVTGGAGIGIGAWNCRGRLAANVVGALRGANEAEVLSELEVGLFIDPRDVQQRPQHRGRVGDEYYQAETVGWLLVSRLALGPGPSGANYTAEGALGFGAYQLTTRDHPYGAGRSTYYGGVTLEAFSTITGFDDRREWLVGGRLSGSLPGDLLYWVESIKSNL
jgi:hypothetical protein